MFTVAGVGAEEPILNLEGPPALQLQPNWPGGDFFPVESKSETYWKLLACKEENGPSMNKREAREEQRMNLRAAVIQHVNMQQILNLVLLHP